MLENPQLKNYERAFSSHSGGCQETCPCGRIFFDTGNSDWDWEEGEFDALIADPNATGVLYSVERIWVQGTLYATDCDCWHEQARRVIAFIDSNARSIAEYLKLDKEYKEIEARQSVTIDVMYDEYKDGWRHIAEAPRNATTLEVLMRDRTTKQAHWAQDLSGEEQPPFRGWFVKSGEGFGRIEDPIAWRYLEDAKGLSATASETTTRP